MGACHIGKFQYLVLHAVEPSLMTTSLRRPASLSRPPFYIPISSYFMVIQPHLGISLCWCSDDIRIISIQMTVLWYNDMSHCMVLWRYVSLHVVHVCLNCIVVMLSVSTCLCMGVCITVLSWYYLVRLCMSVWCIETAKLSKTIIVAQSLHGCLQGCIMKVEYLCGCAVNI